MAFRTFQPGEPAPWFYGKNPHNPRFCFDTIAGRYVVLSFFGSASSQFGQQLLSALASVRYHFNDEHASWFGVSIDPADEMLLVDDPPGIRFFFDPSRIISAAYGAADQETPAGEYHPRSLVLDERLRVLAVLPMVADPLAHVHELANYIAALPPLVDPARADVQAPILVVPRIFEPDFCRTLIQFHEEHGGRESGFMREEQGKTVEVFDHNHKRRRDQELQDENLRRECMIRIHDRLVPEIKKAFQFNATRIERYIVACYEAENAGHFRAHRDNTTKGTAHRRFAVSLNLNTGEYEGGDLRFPEFGRQLYTAPAGGAVVFSCSLLHEATPVTGGRRYVFLPFLYDEDAARIRQQNLQYLA